MFSEDFPLWEEMYVKKIIPHLPFTENLLLAHNETTSSAKLLHDKNKVQNCNQLVTNATENWFLATRIVILVNS